MLTRPWARRITGLETPLDLKRMDWVRRAAELDTRVLLIHSEDDDFGQAVTLVREVFSAQEREDFVETVAGALKGVRQDVQARAFEYWKNVDATIGQRIEDEVKRHEGDGIPGVEAGGEARI